MTSTGTPTNSVSSRARRNRPEALERTELLPIDPEMRPLVPQRDGPRPPAEEDIDSLREVLAFAFEASLMIGQNQQMQTTRDLAAWAAILAVPTAVAGIYGMNFKNMPELDRQFGYFGVLLAIFSARSCLFWRFRRDGWL